MPLILPFRRVLGIVPVKPGSVSYATVGTYTFIIPRYRSLFVDVYGAGGGGGGAAYYYDTYNIATGGVQYGEQIGYGPGGGYTYQVGRDGGAGGYSQFYLGGYTQVIGYGGAGGSGLTWFHSSYGGYSPQISAAGTAGGGDANITGGGAGPGTYGYTQSYSPQVNGYTWTYGNYGGYGGRAYRTFSAGQLPIGAAVTIVVGAGGQYGWQYTSTSPTYGGNGVVNISWS
ncbi:hypothetical protein J4G48_0040205 [Bradyrhizobium barranii subsp. apii]|uniref:hypothetical protein n=1 Tax=Bradyrhizobium barranii TaxID=2992140 RepID=UPI001AA0F079|nr:hypothetical protein [Bradyrhizobium barranii]UPT95381.1 hypothetical protein J4G48_0040205 [Bradyrhizobium barranii subsp. apii]